MAGRPAALDTPKNKPWACLSAKPRVLAASLKWDKYFAIQWQRDLGSKGEAPWG